MNYEDMSDSQINAIVTNKLFGCHGWEFSENGGDCSFYHCGADGDGYYEVAVLDYCNNPSDAWPIMIENNIFITATREDHEFKYMTKCLIDGSAGLVWSARFTAYSDNPLRAAMICFLKMKGSEL